MGEKIQNTGYALQAGGSLLSAYGSYSKSKENERVAKYNAKMSLLKGLEQKTAIDAQNKIQINNNRSELSENEAMGGLRGIIMESGSAEIIEAQRYSDMVADQTETTRQGEIARITGENQSAQYKFQAKQIKDSRWMGVVGALLGGI